MEERHEAEETDRKCLFGSKGDAKQIPKGGVVDPRSANTIVTFMLAQQKVALVSDPCLPVLSTPPHSLWPGRQHIATKQQQRSRWD